MTCGNKGVLRREGRCHPTTVIFMGLKTKRPAHVPFTRCIPPGEYISCCFCILSASHAVGTQSVMMTMTMFRPRKRALNWLLAFNSTDAAQKTSKLAFYFHTFIVVPKQLLNKLPSKKKSGKQAQSFPQFPGDEDCDGVTPPNPLLKLTGQQGELSVSMSTLEMKTGAESVVCENYRDVYHFSAIQTCSTVELLALSRVLPLNFLPDCYYIGCVCCVLPCPPPSAGCTKALFLGRTFQVPG